MRAATTRSWARVKRPQDEHDNRECSPSRTIYPSPPIPVPLEPHLPSALRIVAATCLPRNSWRTLRVALCSRCGTAVLYSTSSACRWRTGLHARLLLWPRCVAKGRTLPPCSRRGDWRHSFRPSPCFRLCWTRLCPAAGRRASSPSPRARQLRVFRPPRKQEAGASLNDSNN
jgi:hypothetical protein